MADIQNLSPKAVRPIELLSKTNEMIDVINESVNSSYSEQNPVLTSVDGVCTWTITHNLGTEEVSCTVYEGDSAIIADVEITSENVITVTINSATNIAAETYSVLVLIKGGVESSGGGSITVDDALSSTSTNPVQNRVIYAAIGNIEALLAAI